MIHGILCPVIIGIRRDKGAPIPYTNLQGWVHTLHLTDPSNISRFLTMCRKLHDIIHEFPFLPDVGEGNFSDMFDGMRSVVSRLNQSLRFQFVQVQESFLVTRHMI